MQTEQREEWSVLEKQAYALLRSGIAENRRLRQRFQILILASFAPSVSWEVCEKGHRTEPPTYCAVQTIWQSQADSEKFRTPVERLRHPRPLFPTMEVRTFPLEVSLFEEMISKLKSLSLPILADMEGIGLDGVSYELAFDNAYVKARYHWWTVPPASWKPLHTLTLELIRSLESLVD